jgi:hypothetical protein
MCRTEIEFGWDCLQCQSVNLATCRQEVPLHYVPESNSIYPRFEDNIKLQ